MIKYTILFLLVIANVVTGLWIVHTRHHYRQTFVVLSRLERERDELNIEFGRLQLEQATLTESQRIDYEAQSKLGMKSPSPEDTVLVRR